MRKILITGGASAIAGAAARLFAKDGTSFFLVDRNAERLKVVADDLRVRGAGQVKTMVVDLNDFEKNSEMLNAADEFLGGIDIVFVAHGGQLDQLESQKSWELTQQEITTNYLSVVSVLTEAANMFEKRRKGIIAVVSSAAGDRGRQSNYIYGSAKGGVSIFLQGLRNRLEKSGVAVVTIKPAFIDTPLTASMEKGLLWVKPEKIAPAICRAIVRKKEVVYVPWFWQWIMLVIKIIPESIFKKLKL